MPMVYALLPALVNSLAHGRQEKRLGEWFAGVEIELQRTRDQVHRFSDAQYRLTVGILQAALEDVDEQKLRMLKAAILNVASSD